ncbi:flippase-like domain-containing protein [Croceicoccus ponticola]|uniref:Flippase-like domain-containing protein n=1 Tax=Croceicoccus ponticola TaxID=2217664 RepID=A0A437GZJ2_9SPHN|nr:lysylphosphatidylglycerol synthase transmembrane domain-containing protein [Croceicoccus ponticola]RVQ68765.1 flippase-like domain-containing protein [Croceicoccus ponticola]
MTLGSGRYSLIAALLILAAIVFAALHFGDLTRFVVMVQSARPEWIIFAIVLQLCTYVSVSKGWLAVLQRAGILLTLRRIVPIAFSKLFVDQVVPAAGMGGNVLLVDRLTALGVPRRAAIAALLVSMVGYYAAYAVLSLLMLILLWVHREATPLLVGLVTTFLIVALAIPSLALWLRGRGSKPLPPTGERFPPLAKLLSIIGEAPSELVRDPLLILRVAGWNALVFLADAATLAACLHSIGGPFSFSTAFIALMMASIAVTLAPLPLGLGSFEASATATLSMLGIPIAAALAATLLLRTLTLWLPLIPGFLLIRRTPKIRGGV